MAVSNIPNWDSIRKEVFKRDNWHCRACGIPQHSYLGKKNNRVYIDSLSSVISTLMLRDSFTFHRACNALNVRKIYLQVHHIDHDRNNNSLDNLILLCPRCHAFIGNYPDLDIELALKLCKSRFGNLIY